jgi:hypothetical protein
MPTPRRKPVTVADARRATRKALRRIIALDRKNALKTFPAEFLNVDLDIKSRVDPRILVEAWGNQVIPHLDKLGRRHWLRMMLASGPESPSDAIRRFAKLVHKLPTRGRTIWTQASKEFDIGIQAGFERRSGEWVLEPAVVQMAADLGARVRLTVYSALLVIHENGQLVRLR